VSLHRGQAHDQPISQQQPRRAEHCSRRRGHFSTLYWAQEKYEEALPYYEQCLPIHREVGNKAGEGSPLNNIATIYDAQGKPSKALEYQKQALEIRRELGDRAGEAVICWNIGYTYYNPVQGVTVLVKYNPVGVWCGGIPALKGQYISSPV